MADKRIDQLTEASSLTAVDLMVTEQSGIAKKVTGNILANSAWNMLQKDASPTKDSTAPVTSGAVYDALGGVFSPAKVATPGALVHFEDGAYKKPLEALRLAIDPVQSGTGDPSPDNVRPISGHTVVTVGQTNENLIVSRGNLWPNSNGVVERSPSYQNVILRVEEGKTYRLNVDTSENHNMAYAFYTSFPVEGSVSYNESRIVITGVINAFVAPITGFCLFRDLVDATISEVNEGNAVLGVAEDSHLYQISLSSAGTVYGGTLDALTGKLTVTKKAVILTGEESGLSFGWNGVYLTVPELISSSGSDAISECMCSHSSNIITGNSFFNSANTDAFPVAASISLGPNVRFRNRAVGNSLESYREYLQAQNAAGTPVTVVGKLATPITYQLTPVEVLTLLGENNIWADTGDIEELVYRADIGLYLVEALNPIKELIANREDSMKATRSYVKGDYIIVGDTFYKAATAIANGATLTPNTNVIKTTVGDQLKQLST